MNTFRIENIFGYNKSIRSIFGVNQKQIVYNKKTMIKAPLTYHDPLDIYDYFRKQYGTLSMLIKGNYAILTFENMMIKKQILDNPKRLIKGLPVTISSLESDQQTGKV